MDVNQELLKQSLKALREKYTQQESTIDAQLDAMSPEEVDEFFAAQLFGCMQELTPVAKED